MQVSSEQGRSAAFPSKGGDPWFCRGRLLLDNILLNGFAGLGFAGDWLFGDWFGWHGKKDICPIEAEATRKNHRHPIGVVKAQKQVVGMTFSVAMASVNRWTETLSVDHT